MNVELILEKTLSGLGYELVDVELIGRSGLMRVLIDKEAGIGLDDCTLVSNQLTRVFEVEGIEYDRLEVSSPGLDRPLKKISDFEKFCGDLVQIQSKYSLNGQRNFKGHLVAVENDKIELASDDGRSIVFDHSEIKRANLIPVV